MKTIFSLFLLIGFIYSTTVLAEINALNRERTYDVQHYVIRLDFDRKNKTVFGDSTIELIPLKDDFNLLELDAEGIKFDSVKLEADGKDLVFKNFDKKVLITLDRRYDKNEKISVRLKYSAKPKKGIYFVDELKRNGRVIRNSQIWTQGEAEETHFWLPSFDFPDDKATTEQFITVKTGETVIANGELLDTQKNTNGTQTFHYKMPVPHSLYLTSFIVGTYEKVSDKYKDIPLGFYVYPGQRAIVPRAYGKTKDMFRIFEQLTGVNYPYNKYDQTMVANFQFGGMENITATTMADTEIMFAKFPFGKDLVEDLVSHELAHSWFGNLVTCRNWSELWLNEGFATFMEAAFREKMYGRKAYIEKIESDATEFFTYISLRENSQYALFNPEANPQNDMQTMFTPITYQKGGVIIHTLREELGDEIFWKGINTYLNRHKFQNVETADLQKALEEVSGKNLDWFFKQWIYGKGYPKLQIKQIFNQTSKQLELNIAQTQSASNGTSAEFTLPLEIEITTSEGKKIEKILINKRSQNFTISVKSKPLLVAFDKNFKIPLKEIKLSKLTNAP
ncbi:MAG: M1 family metallopeptidase [Acidobacteriota bacterium]|nr:M1 family metallopeptidase [Acidobacteriota bacterium]